MGICDNGTHENVRHYWLKTFVRFLLAKIRRIIHHNYNPGQKSLGQYYDIHIFLSFVGSLLKQCILFEIFLQFSLPPPYTKLKLGKNFGYTCPTLFVGWGEGLHLCELENAPGRQKCHKNFNLSMIVATFDQIWKKFAICELMTSIMQQNCQIIERLAEKTWGRGWVVLVVNTKWRNISPVTRGRNRRAIG